MIAVSQVSVDHDGWGGTAPDLGFPDGPWVEVNGGWSLNLMLLPGRTVSICCAICPPSLGLILVIVGILPGAFDFIRAVGRSPAAL